MTALSLTLLVTLAAVGTPPRGTRPTSESETGPAPTQAMSDEEVTARAQTYLGAIDTPVTAAQWRALGARVVPYLETVLQDRQALPSRRAKAVDALSIIGGARAKQLVLAAAQSDREPFPVRASAVRGAARLLPAKELAGALQPVMENAPRPAIRATAAEVLARHGGPSACAAVQAQVQREPARHRLQFSRALETCSTSP